MILAQGARGPGFNSRSSPICDLFFCFGLSRAVQIAALLLRPCGPHKRSPHPWKNPAGHSGNLRGAGHPPIDCTAGTPSMCNVQLTTPRMLQAPQHFACVECDAPAHFTHVQHTTQHDEHPAGHLINWFVLPVTPPTCALLSDYHSERDPPTQQRERERERGKDLKRKRDREGGRSVKE